MDNQGFINFNENINSNPIDSSYNFYINFFKEIFSSCYGAQNVNFLKEGYLYFDKYGKQRKIDFAIFTPKAKYAVIFDGFETNVCEEYRLGDRKIIETSLKSQGWEIYYWSNKGKKEQIRKKTYKDLQTMLGKNPSLQEHMGITEHNQSNTGYIAPIAIIAAIVGALVIFPKISDKLFSTTRLKEKNVSVDYNKLDISPKTVQPKTLDKKNKVEQFEEYNSEDF